MLLTALSYGRMARAYPSAGSAFTYVGQTIHPSLGYVTGWSMVMDYVLNPHHLHHLLHQAGHAVLALAAARGRHLLLRPALHRAEPARHQGQRAHQPDHRHRAGRGGRPLPGRRPALPVGRAALGRGPHPALLRPGHLRDARRADRRLHRLPDLHRLRRHLDPVGGGGEPATQHPARHRPHLPDHRRAGHAAGLRGPARLGRLEGLPRRGHGVRARGEARRAGRSCSRW